MLALRDLELVPRVAPWPHGNNKGSALSYNDYIILVMMKVHTYLLYKNECTDNSVLFTPEQVEITHQRLIEFLSQIDPTKGDFCTLMLHDYEDWE